jgi:transcriptional regulator with XRE-family HTH domain
MKTSLKPEQLSFAISRLKQLMQSRGVSPTELHRTSGVSQSHISRIFSGEHDPGPEVLDTLLESIGVRLNDVLNEIDSVPAKMVGYLATPLSAVAGDPLRERALREAVKDVVSIASEPEFGNPKFEIYWPGYYTHPTEHPNIPASEVYLVDRSRASSYDFVILLCADPSYGVGQENEIATQAGRPAIRLVPPKLSRMMVGSFLRAINVPYEGSLDMRIVLKLEEMRDAFREVRRIHFKHRAFHRWIEQDGFGARLADLIKDHAGDYQSFAEDVGVSLSYVLAMMNEPLIVSNPSSQLLLRMAGRLGVSAAYLLGESPELDNVMSESKANWFAWMRANSMLNAQVAVEALDEWRAEYQRTQTLATVKSFRAIERPISVIEWNERYEAKKRKPNDNGQLKLV